MYENSLDTMLHGTGRETFNAVKIMQSIQKQTYMPANGAKYRQRAASAKACSRSRN